MKKAAYSILWPIVVTVIVLGFTLTYLNMASRKGTNTIVVGYHPNFGGASAVTVGINKGYFKEEGLDVKLVSFSSGPPSIAALEAGDIDISFLGHGATTFLMAGKADVIAVDSLSYAEQILAHSDSGIETVIDLKGKKIATPLGTSGENFLDIVLDRYGVNREEMEVINYDVNGAVTAFINGSVDAISIWAPYTNEVRSKLGNSQVKTIIDCVDLKGELYLPMSWVSTDSYIASNPEKIELFVKALYKSLDYRAENLEEVAVMTAKQIGGGYNELLQDIHTAEWLTTDSMKEFIDKGMVLPWYRSLHEFFLKKSILGVTSDVDDYLRLEFIMKVLR